MKVYTELLPSGKWRSKAIYKDQNGKNRSKSFTAGTREESRLNAIAYYEKIENEKRPEDKTIDEILRAYIESRSDTLSQTTRRKYNRIRYKAFYRIAKILAGDLTLSMYQESISQYAKGLRKVKKGKEAHSLLKRAFKYNDFDFDDRAIKLPKPPKISTVPTDEEIKKIFEAGTQKDIYLPILLAATMGLGRKEIFSLTWNDVDFNNQLLRIKDYTIPMSPSAVEAFEKRQGGELFNYSMEAFDSRFKRVMAGLGLEHNYHSLIRYSRLV